MLLFVVFFSSIYSLCLRPSLALIEHNDGHLTTDGAAYGVLPYLPLSAVTFHSLVTAIE